MGPDINPTDCLLTRGCIPTHRTVSNHQPACDRQSHRHTRQHAPLRQPSAHHARPPNNGTSGTATRQPPPAVWSTKATNGHENHNSQHAQATWFETSRMPSGFNAAPCSIQKESPTGIIGRRIACLRQQRFLAECRAGGMQAWYKVCAIMRNALNSRFFGVFLARPVRAALLCADSWWKCERLQRPTPSLATPAHHPPSKGTRVTS